MDTLDVSPDGQAEGSPPVAPAQEAVDSAAAGAPPKRAPKPKPAEPAAPAPPSILATGRRKEAVARVRILPGPGTILVNKQPLDRYFPRELSRMAIRQPLLITHHLGKLNVLANVEGGGLMGQAGAVRLGIARALVQLDPALRAALRGAGLLTRDPRGKERKKYGQKGARKRFQWTKR